MENIDWVKIENIINNFECETTWWTIEDNAYRTALKLSDCLKDYLPIKNKLFEIIKPIIINDSNTAKEVTLNADNIINRLKEITEKIQRYDINWQNIETILKNYENNMNEEIKNLYDNFLEENRGEEGDAYNDTVEKFEANFKRKYIKRLAKELTNDLYMLPPKKLLDSLEYAVYPYEILEWDSNKKEYIPCYDVFRTGYKMNVIDELKSHIRSVEEKNCMAKKHHKNKILARMLKDSL